MLHTPSSNRTARVALIPSGFAQGRLSLRKERLLGMRTNFTTTADHTLRNHRYRNILTPTPIL